MNNIVLNSFVDTFSSTFNIDKSRFQILPASFTSGFPRIRYEQSIIWFDLKPFFLHDILNSYLLFYDGTMLHLSDPNMMNKLLANMKDYLNA